MTPRPTPSLPPELCDTFRQFRGDTDASYFGLGDAVDAAIVELAGRVKPGAIYKAASLETDYSIAEVRMLRDVARHTPLSLRAEFGDVLVHAHFRAVAYLTPEQQHTYLSYARDSADSFGGRPMPAVELKKKIQKELGIAPPPPTFAELQARAVAALEKLRDLAAGKQHDALNSIINRVDGMQAEAQ